MAITITMPKLGAAMISGSVREWNKKIGDPVRKGELLCVVATDKLTAEVESPADGFLIAVAVREGEEAPADAPVGFIGAREEEVPGAADLSAQPDSAAGLPLPPDRTGGRAVLCSPKAGELAREKGVDLSAIKGTGPNGWIVERDVFNALNAARGIERPGVSESSGERPPAVPRGPRPLVSPVAAKMAAAAEPKISLESFGAERRVMKADILAGKPAGTKKRVAVIGGGPGGYVAAIRAAQLGAAVTVIEKNRLGGTCLNAGCIPTKVLLRAAELYTAMKEEGPGIGIFADNLRFDWAVAGRRKEDVVNHLVMGVEGLLKSNGVECVYGEARLTAPNAVEIAGESGRRSLEADAVVLAAGSEPAIPPVPGLNLENPDILTSDGALSLDALPKSIVVAGGGVVGLEFASLFASLGADVAVVEMLPRILPGADAEIAAILRRTLESKGVNFYTDARLERVARAGNSLVLDISTGSGPAKLAAEKLLAATGRRPRTGGLGLEAAGVKTQRGRIAVNARMETSVPNVYAIGDCASPIMLAHVASREGEVAAENIMGYPAVMDYKTVPSAVYTSPAVAFVGLSEEAALETGVKVRVGRFPLAANGKSVLSGNGGGMVKIVSEERYGEVLGVHIVGGPAAEMIGEGGLALRLEATLDEIVSAVHAHPTVSEALGEAALASWGRAIHLPKG
jgi:dihydrolipoamide dehydrogenase